MLSMDVLPEYVDWERIMLTLRSLAFLLEHQWLASDVTPEMVASLLNVFRYFLFYFNLYLPSMIDPSLTTFLKAEHSSKVV